MSFTHEFPDAKTGVLAAPAGKLKIDAPKAARSFNCDFLYVSGLSDARASYGLSYYFPNDEPIYLIWDKSIGMYKIAESGEVEIHVERDPEKWMSIKEKYSRFIGQGLTEPETYLELDRVTREIYQERNKRFVLNRKANQGKKDKVGFLLLNYRSGVIMIKVNRKGLLHIVVPQGMTKDQYKV